MAPSEVDFYRTLAVHRHATDDEIKKAFRKAARDTHPDKNPDDPMAKEKFQELQRAYDTLKDQLERSKYDEDNPSHGHPEGSRPKPKSTTAKRYTTGSSTGPTGPAGGVPNWTPNPSQFQRGFPHQAHQAHSTAPRHTGNKPGYEEFPSSTYSSARRQRSGGFDYGGSFRAQAPKPTATDFEREREDSYGSYYNQQDRAYTETPRARESAYSRASSQRQPNATPAGTPKPSSSTRRAHSTVGGQRDPGAQAPDFNIGAYIKERRAKAEEQLRRDEEAARQREDEEAAMKEAAREAARESLRAERREQHRRAEAEKEARRAEAEAEAEARRAEEDARRRSHWAQAQTQTQSQFSRNDARPDPPLFHDPRDEDNMRAANERLAEGQRRSRASTTTSRSNSRRSPTKPKVQRDNEWGANGHSDGLGVKSGNASDHSGSFRHFGSADDGEGPNYQENILKREKERQAAERAEQQREHQWRWEEMSKSGGENIHQGHGRTKSETQRRERPNTPDRPRTSGHGSSLGSASEGSKRESPSFDSSNKRRQSSTDFRFKFSPGMARVDSYRSEPPASPPSPRDSPFQKKPDFSFHGEEVPSSFTYTTPEGRSQHNPNNLHAAPMFIRPQSQPVYPTQPQHVPISRPTPQPQQQQQQQRQRQTEYTGFKKELFEGLAQTAHTLFNYQPPFQSSPKKKKSSASVKNFTKFRTKSKESVGADGSTSAKVESGDSSEEGSSFTAPKQRGEGGTGTPHIPVAGDEGFEPMDTDPDTGIPDPINIQAARLNGYMGSKSPMGNTSPRIPTPLSPRSTKEDGLDTMHKLGSVHPLKANGLDSMSNLATAAPFSRSPAEVGLNGLDELKDNLPFPSRPSGTPKPGFTGPLPKFKPDLRDIYGPATPVEDPFFVPVPPKVPRTPKEIELTAYNQFFMRVETYVEMWNVYEDKVRKLQADLCGRSLKDVMLDTNAIMDYIKRVKEKDFVLEESYRRAREKHMSALEDWVRYRATVVDNRK